MQRILYYVSCMQYIAFSGAEGPIQLSQGGDGILVNDYIYIEVHSRIVKSIVFHKI